MSEQNYTVRIANDSGRLLDVCLYQRNPAIGPDMLPVAWFAKTVADSGKVTVRWSPRDWNFVWAQTGRLAPGTVVDVAQAWPADAAVSRPANPPLAGNCVGLTRVQGAYKFFTLPAEPPVPAGNVQVAPDHEVLTNQASIGIGMGTAAVLVTQARLADPVNFPLEPTYYVAAGKYSPGQVLDSQPIPNSPEIVFPAGVYSMDATFQANGRWLIEPTELTVVEVEVAVANLMSAGE